MTEKLEQISAVDTYRTGIPDIDEESAGYELTADDSESMGYEPTDADSETMGYGLTDEESESMGFSEVDTESMGYDSYDTESMYGAPEVAARITKIAHSVGSEAIGGEMRDGFAEPGPRGGY